MGSLSSKQASRVYITSKECSQYEKEIYNETIQNTLIQDALNSVKRGNISSLKQLLQKTYVKLTPISVEKEQLFLFECHPYIDLNTHGNQLLAAAFKNQYKNIVKYLLAEGVTPDKNLILEYINTQTKMVTGIGQTHDTNYIDTFLQNQDPNHCALSIFKSFFYDQILPFTNESYSNLNMIVRNASICLSKSNQINFFDTCYRKLESTPFCHELKQPTPDLVKRVSEFKKFLTELSNCGMSVQVMSIDQTLEDFDTDILPNHPCLIQDTNEEFYFWGYTQGYWELHQIGSTISFLELQNIPINTKENQISFIHNSNSLFKKLIQYHTPFGELIDRLDAQMSHYANQYNKELDILVNDMMGNLSQVCKVVKKGSSLLLFKDIVADNTFIQLYKNLTNIILETDEEDIEIPIYSDEQIINIITELCKAYNKQNSKNSIGANLLKNMLDKFKAIGCVEFKMNGQLFSEISLTDRHMALKPITEICSKRSSTDWNLAF